MASDFDFLDVEHPIYEARKVQWEQDERRMLGLPDVAEELREFDYELPDGDAHRKRKSQATYVNFPAEVATIITGHVFANAPLPDAGLDFGALGQVRRIEDISGVPTEAELLYYNTDGVGNDGSQWDSFWSGAMQRACATGHRWILGDASQERPLSREDELRGQRPYLTEFSPLDVPNWHFAAGTLMFAVVRLWERNPIVTGGTMEGNSVNKGYLLLVRQGYTGLGAQFSEGGWWRFDADKGSRGHRPYTATNGEIPVGVLYAQRAPRLRGLAPSMSKSLTTEVGNIAVAYMNLSSARDNDVWDAAKSITYLLGADKTTHAIVVGQMKSGSKVVTVPPLPSGQVPQIGDSSMGAVPAAIMQGALDAKLAEADRLSLSVASYMPDSSGASKRAGFQDLKAPKLRLVVSEIEACQNTMIRFMELLWGKRSPSGYALWSRKFDLAAFTEDLQEVFDLVRTAGAESATLVEEGIARSVQEKGIIADDAKIQTMRDELRASIETGGTSLTPGERAAQQTERAVLAGGAGAGGNGTSGRGSTGSTGTGVPTPTPAPAPTPTAG